MLYSLPTCGPCKSVKAALVKRDIPHTVVDLSELDDEALNALRTEVGGGQLQTPTLRLSNGALVVKDIQRMLDAIRRAAKA